MRFLIDGQTLSTPEISRGIGVVFKRICEELVLKDISKEWFITVRDRSDLKHFSQSVQKRLIPITIAASLQQDGYANQTKHYSQLLNQVVTEFKIDAYWVPNPLMLNIILPTQLKNTTIFATIHDLIPLVMAQEYICKWPQHLRAEYEHRIATLPGWVEKLIFVSESTKNDFAKIDSRIVSKSIVIPSAVEHTKFWSYISPTDKSREPYILFTGGFDPRKNMHAALEAFSYLLQDNDLEFKNLKLYVVCAYSEHEKQNYENLAAKLGVLDNLVLPGYVEEDELVTLYRQASVFFFPSRYEGFGLPLLEALACGLPVVTTKVSSIPEIVGDLAYYCSPDDPKDMAIALKKALSDRARNRVRKQDYIQHARKFTWAKTGASYFKLFTNTLVDLSVSEKLNYCTIAYVSPWPPQRSGIANYSYEIVRYLKEDVDITLGFVNRLKRIPEILQAIKILVEKGYPLQFIIAGEILDPSLKIQEKINSLGISENTIVTGYLPDEDYERLLQLSDIVLNLRYPSLGESSAALMTALGQGKACIVSNYQQFSELPDSVCWKVDIGDLEIPLLVAYLEELMRNPAVKLYSLAISKVIQSNRVA
jgi:glycosyltransferase involved in cell wall biosynthesis